uniref:General transcription factor IIE subunit 1 n=1 Tax=Cacopsylla melanoneura TaxID=428564 RepID=A0A8D9A8V4_9HEMI
MSTSDEGYVHTEVPTSLKQLARLVVRGFYSIEDSLLIDMLVRNPCMKEDDICELLKFERKMLRARISTLKTDKIIQTRLRMETGPDGKAQKVNYYFINYQSFVNIVKYKLDMMRKRMEMEERDATSRSSFKCPRCLKTFTDLEADQLFDMMTQEFRCTFCGGNVEEDLSAMPKKDSRLLLAKFNSQLEPLFVLLREVEGIKLAPELLEPEPVDLSTILGTDKKNKDAGGSGGKQWSGEATRNMGFITDDTKVNVMVGDDAIKEAATVVKERPVWMTESTIITNDESTSNATVVKDDLMDTNEPSPPPGSDDIMSVLLQHEKRGQKEKGGGMFNKDQSDSDDSDSDLKQIMREASQSESFVNENDETMNSDDEDDDDEIPVISVGSQKIAVTDIDDKIINEMTPQEKQIYIQVYQEYYSSIYD